MARRTSQMAEAWTLMDEQGLLWEQGMTRFMGQHGGKALYEYLRR